MEVRKGRSRKLGHTLQADSDEEKGGVSDHQVSFAGRVCTAKQPVVTCERLTVGHQLLSAVGVVHRHLRIGHSSVTMR